MTPFALQFLLHCRYSKEPFQNPESSALEGIVKAFLREGVIYKDLDTLSYQLTPLGEFHIGYLLSKPLPAFTYDGAEERAARLTKEEIIQSLSKVNQREQ